MGGRGTLVRLAACAAGVLALGTTLLTPRRADAFCGFYVSGSGQQLTNKATRVALMREGTRTVLTMSNDYGGPPENFAMVVPVPIVLQQTNVKTLPMNIFEHLEELTAPRLVEYWEQDPCYREPPMEAYAMSAGMAPPTPSPTAPGSTSLGVRIEAQFTVGEYQVLVLSATESTGLETWLRQNHYNIPQGAAEALAPYIREQSKFFVAKVDITKVQRKPDGGARLSPLRFHYDTPEFRLPVRLGLLNASADPQDLIVYVLHKTSRFETANYKNVFIPTNLDVTEETRARFGEFYTALFDATLKSAGGRAVITEYAWGVGGCDPCPGPPMASGEMATLGGDVLYANPPQQQPQEFYSSGVDYIVTRLHTRYDKATLSEDLVFREAPSVVGGREHTVDANGALEQGAVPDTSGNNFQARYAIRHRWKGAITCNDPRRNVWGGPPADQQQSNEGTSTARNLESAPRGNFNLPAAVVSASPELNLTGGGRTPPGLPPMSGQGGAAQTSAGPVTKRGCACATPGQSAPSPRGVPAVPAVIVGLVCAAGLSRRRNHPHA